MSSAGTARWRPPAPGSWPALQVQAQRPVSCIGATLSVSRTWSWLAGTEAAFNANPWRRVLRRQGDLAAKPVLPQGIHGDGNARAAANADAGRHHPEIEIRPGRAEPQAVGILRAALMLHVAQMQIVGSIGGQGSAEIGIGLVRDQPLSFVLRSSLKASCWPSASVSLSTESSGEFSLRA